MEKKVCKCCGRELSLDHFKRGRYDYVSVCLDCDKKHRAEKRQARNDEQKQKEKEEALRAEKRNLCLADFTPRELMEELKRRGYEGRLTYIETHVIDLSTI